MDWWQIIEAITLITGVIYMVMEIYQGRLMWYFDIVSVGCAVAVNAHVHLWANAVLNLYFLIMAVLGIIYWRKYDRSKGIHIEKMSPSMIFASIAVLITGGSLICYLMTLTDNPQPIADGISFILSIIGAWWLTRSYIENWFLWAAADVVCLYLFIEQRLWGMAVLYACYTIVSIIGYFYWRAGSAKQS